MWIIASLNRPAKLAGTLAQICKIGVSTPGLVMVGPDDALPDTLPPGWKAMRRDPADVRMPAGLNRAFAMFPDEPWFGFMDDSTLVHTPGWDQKLIAAAGRTGMASGNDDWQFHNGRVAGACAFGAELLKAFGWWHPPFLDHCYGDDFWEEIGRRFGNLRRLADVRFTHETPFNKTAKPDVTFNLAYASKDKDQKAWNTWRAGPEFAALIGRVASLLVQADPVAAAKATARLERARSRRPMICTPVARAPALDFTISYADTGVHLWRTGIQLWSHFVVGSSNLPRARNELVARFLASDCTDLIFIDDDMGWKPESIVRLLASEKPLIAGVGRKRVDVPNTERDVWCVDFLDDAQNILHQDDMGAIEVKSVGTAFMKIERCVFEKLIVAHPEWKRPGHDGLDAAVRQNYYRFFSFGDEFERGEDFGFCQDWRSIGGKVFIDPTIWLAHVGGKSWSGCISELMQAGERPQFQEAAE
jgi:hypothetical protein